MIHFNKIAAFLYIIFVSFLSAENVNECSSKKIQVMLPEYPNTNYQGYAVVNFDVNEMGELINIVAIESKCAVSRKEDGSIKFKNCPFFKTNSVQAAKYIKYKSPLNNSGESCVLKNQTHRFTYSLYKRDVKDLDFLLRKEYYDLRKNKQTLNDLFDIDRIANSRLYAIQNYD